MEIFEINNDGYKEQISGWFTAPATGNYRFYISCDDACNLFLDSANPYAGTPLVTKPTPDLIAYRWWTIDWRNYFYNKDEGQKSDWIALEAGMQYYIMTESTSAGNIDHLTVSLEIQSDAISADHPKTSHTIQQLSFS